MGLKKLLTDLSLTPPVYQGFEDYPNHNVSSDAGGFNYGNSFSIFDHKIFNQRSLPYDLGGTSQDNPTPLIPQILPGVEQSPENSLLYLNDAPDGFIRGNALNSMKRVAYDAIRITKFLLTENGFVFANKQQYLQQTNPRIQEGGEAFNGILNDISWFGIGIGTGIGTTGDGINFDSYSSTYFAGTLVASYSSTSTLINSPDATQRTYDVTFASGVVRSFTLTIPGKRQSFEFLFGSTGNYAFDGSTGSCNLGTGVNWKF